MSITGTTGLVYHISKKSGVLWHTRKPPDFGEEQQSALDRPPEMQASPYHLLHSLP
jgi:hypothetical protein